jgi:hypothetical protein
LPTYFEPFEKRYTKYFYELQNTPKTAKAASTNYRLQFRFTSPYNITNSEKIQFILSSTVDLTPSSTPDSLFCIIQETANSYVAQGVGRWSSCTFSTNTYTVTNPTGNLFAGKEYTLTII